VYVTRGTSNNQHNNCWQQKATETVSTVELSMRLLTQTTNERLPMHRNKQTHETRKGVSGFTWPKRGSINDYA